MGGQLNIVELQENSRNRMVWHWSWTALFCFITCFVNMSSAWDTLGVNFFKRAPLPRTLDDARNSNWTQLGPDGCTPENQEGTRMIPPKDTPDMVLIYDVKGDVGGMQSGVPKSHFNESFLGQHFTCPDHYTEEIIDGNRYCWALVYFTDPKTICDEQQQNKNRELIFPGIPSLPKSWYEFSHKDWMDIYYYPGMGHHKAPKQYGNDSCKDVVPLHILYSKDGSCCKINGFVWFHMSTNTTGYNFRQPQENPTSNWEKPNEYFVRAIYKEPAHCIIDLVRQKRVTSMHTYLRTFTEPCEPADSWAARMTQLQECDPEEFEKLPMA